jgi:hypothetical protein
MNQENLELEMTDTNNNDEKINLPKAMIYFTNATDSENSKRSLNSKNTNSSRILKKSINQNNDLLQKHGIFRRFK